MGEIDGERKRPEPSCEAESSACIGLRSAVMPAGPAEDAQAGPRRQWFFSAFIACREVLCVTASLLSEDADAAVETAQSKQTERPRKRR